MCETTSRLDPPIPVFVAENAQGFPVGPGLAIALLDYGIEHHVLRGVGYDDGGAVW